VSATDEDGRECPRGRVGGSPSATDFSVPVASEITEPSIWANLLLRSP
jgi:hypothetical protein